MATLASLVRPLVDGKLNFLGTGLSGERNGKTLAELRLSLPSQGSEAR